MAKASPPTAYSCAMAHPPAAACHATDPQKGDVYQEGGPDYYEAVSKDRLKEQLLRRLEKLGYNVRIEEPAA